MVISELPQFQSQLEAIQPQIGDYRWLWRLLKARARQTGYPPRKLYPLLRRFCNPKRPYFVGETLEQVAFLGNYQDRYSIDRMVCPQTERPLANFLIERMRSLPGTYVDVGANVGILSAAVARALPETPVVAIEPMPETGRRTMATFALNRLARTRFLSIAVGDTNEELTFYDAPGHSDMASANPAQLAIPIDWTETRVPCRALDFLQTQELWERVGLLKLDVEGHEYKALQGATNLLRTDRPHLLFEYNREIAPQMGWTPQDAIDLILQQGRYRFYTLGEEGELSPFTASDQTAGFDNLYAEPV